MKVITGKMQEIFYVYLIFDGAFFKNGSNEIWEKLHIYSKKIHQGNCLLFI